MFKATLDKLSKGITLGVALLSLLMSGLFSFIPDSPFWIALIPLVTLGLVILFTFIYSPLGYSVNNEHLVIHRRINSFQIPKKSIQKVYAVSPAEMGSAIRLMGNGGMFGYTGIYRSKSQGTMEWFVTQRKNYLVIETNYKKKYVLSPDDVNACLDAIQL